VSVEWIDGYYIRDTNIEVYEKHEFEFGNIYSATINGERYTDLYYPAAYYEGGEWWYWFSSGRHRVTYPPNIDPNVYYFDPVSYSNQINMKIGDRYKIQFQNLVVFNSRVEAIKYARQLDYDASKIIRGTPIAPPIVPIPSNGGGATHIAKRTGTLVSIGSSNLSDVLIVSGGGGGGLIIGEDTYAGKDAGGISGSGNNSANQTTGYAFGQGESGEGVSGGGGGLYGGYKGSNG